MNILKGKLTVLTGVGVALAALVASPASHAQPNSPNIEKLKQMKVSGTDPNIPMVPQTGKNADLLRENLKRVKLPPGFKIDLYAVVPDARMMAVAPSTNMLFVGTRKTTVWAVTNRNSGDVGRPRSRNSRRRSSSATRTRCAGPRTAS